MQWFTRSAPTVSCRSSAKAIFNFVPTPSTLATRTGSRIPEKFGANKPPKPPILPSTSGPWVLRRAPGFCASRGCQGRHRPRRGRRLFSSCLAWTRRSALCCRRFALRNAGVSVAICKPDLLPRLPGGRHLQRASPYFNPANNVGCASSASALARVPRFSMMNLSRLGIDRERIVSRETRQAKLALGAAPSPAPSPPHPDTPANPPPDNHGSAPANIGSRSVLRIGKSIP